VDVTNKEELTSLFMLTQTDAPRDPKEKRNRRNARNASRTLLVMPKMLKIVEMTNEEYFILTLVMSLSIKIILYEIIQSIYSLYYNKLVILIYISY
jgi:hypothetical protein